MNVLIELAISTILAASGQISWKLGMKGVGSIQNYDVLTLTRMFSNVYVVLGTMLYAFSTIFWLSALSKKDLSYAYPFIAGTYIMVLLLSTFFLHEELGFNRLLGASIVLAGLVVIIRGG